MGLAILGFLLGIMIGMIIISVISIDTINEKQSLIDASRHSLAIAESMMTQRNKLIEKQQKRIEELEQTNREQREFIDEATEQIKEVIQSANVK